jgi:hypothetical protein
MAEHQQHWQRGEAQAASGSPPKSFDSLIERGIVKLGPGDREPSGSGTVRLFGRRTIQRMALLGAIIEAGLYPRSAAAAASAFIDRGQCGRPPPASFSRPAALCLFTTAETSLASSTPRLRTLCRTCCGRQVAACHPAPSCSTSPRCFARWTNAWALPLHRSTTAPLRSPHSQRISQHVQ